MNGKYIKDGAETESSEETLNEELQGKLWELSARYCHLEGYEPLDAVQPPAEEEPCKKASKKKSSKKEKEAAPAEAANGEEKQEQNGDEKPAENGAEPAPAAEAEPAKVNGNVEGEETPAAANGDHDDGDESKKDEGGLEDVPVTKTVKDVIGETEPAVAAEPQPVVVHNGDSNGHQE